jgi:hypothetical protein
VGDGLLLINSCSAPVLGLIKFFLDVVATYGEVAPFSTVCLG